MSQPGLNGSDAPAAIADYRRQARDFLARSWEYLADDDLHQASEKGWGAAAWMAKAVAEAQGWEYRRHEQFNTVLNNARRLTGSDRLPELREVANGLHMNFYTRRRFLDADIIMQNLNSISELLDTLEPLTGIDG